MKRLILGTIATVALGFASTSVPAYEAGDVVLRAGVAVVSPSGVDSDPLQLNGAPLPGTKVDEITNGTALGITGAYFFTDKFALELLAATPFKHDIKVKGLEPLGIRTAGDTKQLPPTLSAQFYPLGKGSKFQPYIGIGLNYTTFFSSSSSSELSAGLAPVTGFYEDYSLDLDDSWGISGEIGADYFINENLALNASLWRIQIETEANFKGKISGTRIRAKDVKINPWVVMVGIGYRF